MANGQFLSILRGLGAAVGSLVLVVHVQNGRDNLGTLSLARHVDYGQLQEDAHCTLLACVFVAPRERRMGGTVSRSVLQIRM